MNNATTIIHSYWYNYISSKRKDNITHLVDVSLGKLQVKWLLLKWNKTRRPFNTLWLRTKTSIIFHMLMFQAKEFRPKTGSTFDMRELLERREEELEERLLELLLELDLRELELLEEEEDLVAFFRTGTRIFLSFSKTFFSSAVSSSWLLLITLMIFSTAFSPTWTSTSIFSITGPAAGGKLLIIVIRLKHLYAIHCL